MEIVAPQGEIKDDPVINAMFSVGAHFGYSKSRRHPSVKPYIFGAKNRVEIFDLEKTKSLLEGAKNYIKNLGTLHKQILLVGGKNESKEAIKGAGMSLGMPYVAGRWIGGTLTNFAEIRSRVDTMIDLLNKREKGELVKYTKKERLLIDRDIERLQTFFTGLVPMKSLPTALFVIDPGKENIAVAEADKVGIPVVALMSSDCNLKEVAHPIVGNDSSIKSIRFFVEEIVSAYKEGEKVAVVPEAIVVPVSVK